MKSKEEHVMEPFFNSPKHWHFEELRNTIRISRPQLSYWLKKLEKDRIIKRVKPRGRMPYYTGMENPEFYNRKRLYGLQKLTNSGLFDHLSALKHAKVVVLFGSFARSDWYLDSDIDLFIYGSDEELDSHGYEMKLHHDIQVHLAKDKKDLKRMDRLLPYIVSGDFIKGSVQDLGVQIHA